MRIYYGLPEDKAVVRELDTAMGSEIVPLPGTFQEFMAAAPAEAVYLPFSLTGSWKVLPKTHESQVIPIEKNLSKKYWGASFIVTGAALRERAIPRLKSTRPKCFSIAW
jgi:hypothetical protein